MFSPKFSGSVLVVTTVMWLAYTARSRYNKEERGFEATQSSFEYYLGLRCKISPEFTLQLVKMSDNGGDNGERGGQN